jgi:hypothetical protein
MTNGGGPGHGRRRGKKGTGKEPNSSKAEVRKRALQRKGWVPEKMAKSKSG